MHLIQMDLILICSAPRSLKSENDHYDINNEPHALKENEHIFDMPPESIHPSWFTLLEELNKVDFSIHYPTSKTEALKYLMSRKTFPYPLRFYNRAIDYDNRAKEKERFRNIVKNNYRLSESRQLLISFRNDWKIVPYYDVIPNLIYSYHNGAIHVRTQTTADLIINKGFYWPGIYEDVRQILKNCKICLSQNPNCPDKSIKPIVCNKPKEHFQLDLTELEDEMISHYKTTYKIICTVEDHFSKFGMAYL